MRTLLEIVHDMGVWTLRAAATVAAWGMWREWRQGHAHTVGGIVAGHLRVGGGHVRDRVAAVWRGTVGAGQRGLMRVKAGLVGIPTRRVPRHALRTAERGRRWVAARHRSGSESVQGVRARLAREAVRSLVWRRVQTRATVAWAEGVLS